MGRNQHPTDQSEHEEETLPPCNVPTWRPERRFLATSSCAVIERHVVPTSIAFRHGPLPTMTMARGQAGGRGTTLNLDRSIMDGNERSFARESCSLALEATPSNNTSGHPHQNHCARAPRSSPSPR